MEIRRNSLLGVPVLGITGDVDHSTAPILDQAIRQSMAPDGQRLIVDLAGCPYIDSGGLAVFLYAARRIRDQGWLGVLGADRNVHRLFEIVGLPQELSFRVFSDEEEVAALLREEAA